MVQVLSYCFASTSLLYRQIFCFFVTSFLSPLLQQSNSIGDVNYIMSVLYGFLSVYILWKYCIPASRNSEACNNVSAEIFRWKVERGRKLRTQHIRIIASPKLPLLSSIPSSSSPLPPPVLWCEEGREGLKAQHLVLPPLPPNLSATPLCPASSKNYPPSVINDSFPMCHREFRPEKLGDN